MLANDWLHLQEQLRERGFAEQKGGLMAHITELKLLLLPQGRVFSDTISVFRYFSLE